MNYPCIYNLSKWVNLRVLVRLFQRAQEYWCQWQNDVCLTQHNFDKTFQDNIRLHHSKHSTPILADIVVALVPSFAIDVITMSCHQGESTKLEGNFLTIFGKHIKNNVHCYNYKKFVTTWLRFPTRIGNLLSRSVMSVAILKINKHAFPPDRPSTGHWSAKLQCNWRTTVNVPFQRTGRKVNLFVIELLT